MLKIKILSDNRQEGKTTLAVKLLQAMPNTVLCVRDQAQRNVVIKKYHLAPSAIARIMYPTTDMRWLDKEMILIDDTN